ncbi:MAG: hypothetical protein IJX26_02640, partial [Clostridia bacterium]|nr:hypothetical protein [Clostridia bacterium]
MFRIYPNNYKVVDGKVIYTLVETVQCVDGSEFKFVQGETYTFSVRALAGEYIDYISSNKSNSVQTAISTGIYNVAMNNGVLVWESDYVDGLYEILITYTTTGGEIVKIKTTTYLKEFALPLNMTDIEGDGRTLTSIYKYSIQVRKLGSSAVLSSFYTTNFDVEKLKTVELTNVYAVDGAIEFVNLKNLADEDIENVIYTLIFENIDHEDVKVANNSFDFENFDAGEIKFRILAEHNDYFASELSEIKTIYKLGIITNFQPIQVNGIYNSLSWSSVKVNNVFADRYEIEFYDTINDISSIAEAVPKNPEDETIVFNLEGIEISNMEIRIRAVSSNSSVVKGSWSERYSLTMAEKINKDHFGVNGLNFEWRQIENETIFDEYILQYTYRETEGQEGYKTESIKVTDYYTITEGEQTIKVYYYTPFAVGIYENISVSVNRLDSLSSNSVIMQTNGVNTKYVFDKFASGDGITKPYQINSFEHLQNINLFKSANYILTANIDLEDITSSLMEGEFTGTFDGQNNSLGHYTQTTETNYTGIFEQSNGAIIKNLTITYANVYINASYNNAKIYGGIVVGNTINTTFENVNISYSTLNINILDNLSSSSDNINSKFYFGGVSGCLTNSNVINCDISLGYINEKTETVYNNIIFSGWSRDQVYYGAISGYVLNSS